jgi:beta-glucosidase
VTDHDHLRSLLERLTLEEKVTLVSGASFWATAPLPSIGLRAMVLSDGPSGVRGPVWDEREPSLSLPSASALAAAWDPELAYQYGAVAAGEARRKGVDVVLGPTINLHRSPLGGRHFEAFSEDPVLSGELAAAYVRGLQDNGVAATPKHFIANDSETDRFTVDVKVAPRVLRELYMLPFELAVGAGSWALMAAYNAVNGVTMTESELLEDPLATEWGFDGVVMSDWTAVRSLDAATMAIDLAMPGPVTAWSETLADAVRDGRISREAIDRKVLRLLLLADRVGAFDDSPSVVPVAVDGRAFARRAAIEGTVLLENRGELPWKREAVSSVAVIGQHARVPRIQGGGSATVIPEHTVSPLDGIRAAVPGATVHWEVGAVVTDGVEEFPLERLTNPHTGGRGVRVSLLDDDGLEIFADDRLSTDLVFFDGDVPLASTRTIVLETVLTPDADESIEIGFASAMRGRVFVDGALLLDELLPVDGDDVGATLLLPPYTSAPVHAHAATAMVLRAEFDIHPGDLLPGAASAALGFAPAHEDSAELIARAVTAAKNADVVLVVVGTTEAIESEGIDRTSLDLPGNQDELVRAVTAANPRTVVVVNAGSPVLLPWRNDVAGVLLSYFGGQEMGSAIADVVFGDAEPGGRLTTTWPDATSDSPVLDVTPVDGVLDYSEGFEIGYRGWLASSRIPAYPFGAGLGYTTWEFGDAEVVGTLDGPDPRVIVTVSNSGTRQGKHVVQVYAERPESAIHRAVRWLVGSSVVRVDGGSSAQLTIPLTPRYFQHSDDAGALSLEPGRFTIRVGSSVTELPITLSVDTSEGVTP